MTATICKLDLKELGDLYFLALDRRISLSESYNCARTQELTGQCRLGIAFQSVQRCCEYCAAHIQRYDALCVCRIFCNMWIHAGHTHVSMRFIS